MSQTAARERARLLSGATQARGRPTEPVLGNVWERQSYRNLFYILSAAPLGLGYALLLVAGGLLSLLRIMLQAILSSLIALATAIARAVARALRFLSAVVARLLVVVALLLLSWLIVPLSLLLLLHARWLGWRGARFGRPFREQVERSLLAGVYLRLERFRRWLLPPGALATIRSGGWLASWGKGDPRPERSSSREPGLAVPAIWRRLIRYEHRFTARWLAIPLSSLPAGDGEEEPFLWSALLFLLVKVPLGLVGWIFALFAANIIGWLLSQPLVVLFNYPVAWLLSSPAFALLSEPGRGLYALAVLALAILSAALGFLLIPPALYVMNALAGAAGNVARLMLEPDDTTRRLREAEEAAARERAKAERAEQVRHELIVNVSHELRTPLASIRGHVESLLLALDDPREGNVPGTLHGYLTIVHRETERLRLLVDELLALAHAESDELRLSLAPVDAAEVVEEVFQSLAPLARSERRVTVARSVEAGLPPVLADRQRLAQVLLNLVRNAIAYTPEGGIVAITLEDAGDDRLRLVVADTGIGIAEEELAHVFDRFYRTEASRARTSDGFGLGLAISKELVAAMGGTISATSRVGEGSSFRLLLQVAGQGERTMAGAG